MKPPTFSDERGATEGGLTRHVGRAAGNLRILSDGEIWAILVQGGVRASLPGDQSEPS